MRLNLWLSLLIALEISHNIHHMWRETDRQTEGDKDRENKVKSLQTRRAGRKLNDRDTWFCLFLLAEFHACSGKMEFARRDWTKFARGKDRVRGTGFPETRTWHSRAKECRKHQGLTCHYYAEEVSNLPSMLLQDGTSSVCSFYPESGLLCREEVVFNRRKIYSTWCDPSVQASPESICLKLRERQVPAWRHCRQFPVG